MDLNPFAKKKTGRAGPVFVRSRRFLGGANAAQPDAAQRARRQQLGAEPQTRARRLAAMHGRSLELARDREESLAPGRAAVGGEAVFHGFTINGLAHGFDEGLRAFDGDYPTLRCASEHTLYAWARTVATLQATVMAMGAKKARVTR